MSFSMNLKKLNENAKIPTYGSSAAAGADLYACEAEEITIKPGETKLIHTGLAMEIPEGEYVNCSANITQSGWQYFDKVDYIKIWYASDSTQAQGGMLYFDDIGFSLNTMIQETPEKGCASALISGAGIIPMLAAAVLVMKKRRK